MSNTELDQPVIWDFPVTAGSRTEPGRREENQDRMGAFSCPFGIVYMIADGMGGYRGGAEAARIVLEAFERVLGSPAPGACFEDAIAAAAAEGHRQLVERSSSGDPNYAGMGSTAVLALIRGKRDSLELVTAHAGDSRAYLHRSGQLIPLTRDHTQVQWLVDSRALDEDEARSHPDSSILTRAMGHGANPSLDISATVPLGDSDGILLCSDGLSGFIRGEDIRNTINRFPEPVQCAQELVRLALDRGSDDNVTVQFIRIGRSPEPIMVPAASRRVTAPETPALVAGDADPSTARRRSRTMAFLAAAAMVAAGGLFAFRAHLFPSNRPSIAEARDPRIVQLEKRADAVERQANQSETTAQNELALLRGLDATRARNPRSSIKELANLEAGMPKLQTRLRDLATAARNTAQSIRDLDSLEFEARRGAGKGKPSNSAQPGRASGAPGGKTDPAAKLNDGIDKVMRQVGDMEKELGEVNQSLDQLRSRRTALMKGWKPAPSPLPQSPATKDSRMQ